MSAEDLEAARRAARERLHEAWRQGRVDADEHERCTTALRHASSPAEVEAAESGAYAEPAGRPVSPVPPLDPRERPPGVGEDDGSYDGRGDIERPYEQPENTERTGGVISLPSGLGNTVMGLTPFAAVILFFTIGGMGLFPSWLWFLLIPIMGILLYGPNGDGS